MIGRTNAGFGGGSGQLYYDVVCQMAEPTKKEGRIWVKSSVAMTRFLFNDAPWSTAVVGTVMVTGNLGGANPSSTNSIIQVFNTKVSGIVNSMKVKPYRCQQVQDSTGNWVNVDAYVCHSNTWVRFSSAWDGELYDSGNQYESVTGGWKAYAGSLTEPDGYLYGQSTYITRIGTVNPIDMTSYTQLHAIGGGYGEYMSEGSALNTKHTVGVSDNPGNGTFLASAVLTTTYAVSGVREVVIDISSITGSHYVSTNAWQKGVQAGVYITKVWMT